jgi:hypothetical protein
MYGLNPRWPMRYLVLKDVSLRGGSGAALKPHNNFATIMRATAILMLQECTTQTHFMLSE